MAARRLVVVMLVLLAISTLAAALLPPPEDRKAATEQTATGREQPTDVPPRPAATNLLLVARMPASSVDPKTVRVERGDELRLDVTAPFGADVEIPGFGLTEPVTRFSPASFDLLASSTGTFPVRIAASGQTLGRILVAKPDGGRCGVSTPAAPQGQASTRSCDRRERRSPRARGRSAPRP